MAFFSEKKSSTERKFKLAENASNGIQSDSDFREPSVVYFSRVLSKPRHPGCPESNHKAINYNH